MREDSPGTPFFRQVYALVRLVPYGKVASYGQIASMLGHPRAARTVGWALASLPEHAEEEVPWQRVINSQGRISIRNLRHAAEEQRLLLEEEGVEFDEAGYLDWERYGWEGLSPAEAEAAIARADLELWAAPEDIEAWLEGLQQRLGDNIA
jgi:methylated-DNA-protein-cysteine methyltransferase-like protein